MKIVIEDMEVGEEIKISCNESTLQEINVESRNISKVVQQAIIGE